MSNSSSFVVFGPNIEVPEKAFAELLWDRLNKRPRHVLAISAETQESLTYEKVLNDSLKLVQAIKNYLQPSDVFAIVSENILNVYIPVVAGILMGATINPVNPDYTIAELNYAFGISKPKLVFCTHKSLNNILECMTTCTFIKAVIQIDSDKSLLNSAITTLTSPMVVLFTLPPELPAYLKGPYLVIPNSVTEFDACLNLTKSDSTILIVPWFHIYGSYILFLSLFTSMKMIFLKKFNPDVFLRTVEDYKITRLYIVPTILQALVKPSFVDKYNVSSLSDILVTGSVLSKEVQEVAIKRFGPFVRIIYGSTEMGSPFLIQPMGNIVPGSLGKVMPGFSSKVWKCDTKENLGPNLVGELCFKGPCVMQEYINNVKATKDSIDEDGFYHSGDLGYYDDYEMFYIVGRIKETIKCKGFQVSLAELEILILTHPMIKDCAVVGIPDENAGEVPHALVVVSDGCVVTEKEVIDYVGDRISKQKRLYGGVRFVNEIPRTSIGKIARHKLSHLYSTSVTN